MTYDILEALVAKLKAHTWTSTQPIDVTNGAIPDVLKFPQIGVIATGSSNIEQTISDLEEADNIEITIAMPVDIDAENANTAALQAMRVEIMRLLYDDPNISGTARSSSYQGWQSVFASFTKDMGDDVFFQYLTLSYSVRYEIGLD